METALFFCALFRPMGRLRRVWTLLEYGMDAFCSVAGVGPDQDAGDVRTVGCFSI